MDMRQKNSFSVFSRVEIGEKFIKNSLFLIVPVFFLLLTSCPGSAGTIGFGTGEYKPLPDTGQKTCYDDSGNTISCTATGQDGEYEGTQKCFSKITDYNGTGQNVTIDNNTKLMWMSKAADVNHDNVIDSNDVLDWQLAKNYCNNLTYAGFSDWRLPAIFELKTIVDFGENGTFVDPAYFSLEHAYWSKTTALAWSGARWGIDLENGRNFHDDNSTPVSVLCVRGGIKPFTHSFSDNEDGTITDKGTNLMWMKETADVSNDDNIDVNDTLTWQAALDYCENLTLANHNDWRLPNYLELSSLVKYDSSDPAISGNFTAVSSGYWTSTTYTKFPDKAQVIDFSSGEDKSAPKSNSNYIRCVRDTIGSDYYVSISIFGQGSGSVTSEPSGIDCPTGECSSTFQANDNVTLTATPGTGSVFKKWLGSCYPCGESPQCTVKINSVKRCVAQFDATQCTTSELAYDDGEENMGCSPFSTDAGSIIVNRFEVSHKALINKLGFYILGDYGKPDTSFEAIVFDENGTTLADINGTGDSAGGWTYLDLSDSQVEVNGVFFVGMKWLTAPGLDGQNAQLLGHDNSNSSWGIGLWHFPGTSQQWQYVPYPCADSGVPMIRVTLTCPNVNATDLGDANGDGKTDIIDALYIARHAVNLSVNEFNEDAADVNCDDQINIVDALLVARKAVGLTVNGWCNNK